MAKPFYQSKTFKVLIVILVLAMAFAAVLSVCIVLARLHYQKKEVIRITQEYLDEKYDETMCYASADYFEIEPAYHVHFYPESTPDLEFYVTIRMNSSFGSSPSSGVGYWLIEDNYIFERYEYIKREEILPEFRSVFGENADLTVGITGLPHTLDEYCRTEDVEPYITNRYYTISLNGNTSYRSYIESNAEKLYDYVKVLHERDPASVFMVSIRYKHKWKTTRRGIRMNYVDSLEEFMEELQPKWQWRLFYFVTGIVDALYIIVE